MKGYEYTNYGINRANKNAIVYRFANGEVKELTVEDFNGDEKAFEFWKKYSDEDYHKEDNELQRTNRKNVSITDLEEMDLGASEGCDIVMARIDEANELQEEINEILSILSEKQRRRLYMAVIKGMKQDEIAQVEGCSQRMVGKSIQASKKKIKKFFEKFSETGSKNASKMTVSERVNFYKRWLASHPDERDNSEYIEN